jgi:hypothetical protein
LNTVPIAPLVLSIIIWLGVGFVCLIWPNKVQAFFARHYAKMPSWYLRYWPFAAREKEWTSKPSYIWYLRGVGFFIFAAGSFLLFFSVFSYIFNPQK